MRCSGTSSWWIIKKQVVTRNINHLLTHRLVHKQRGYADFRRHLPSSLVIRWLAFIRDQNCLCVVCCTPGIESTWIKISITVTPHEHQHVPRQLLKTSKLCITGPLLRGTAVHQWIPSLKVNNTENISMIWRIMSCLIQPNIYISFLLWR